MSYINSVYLPNEHYVKAIIKINFQNLLFRLPWFGAGKLFLRKESKRKRKKQTKQQLFALSFFSLAL